MLVKKLIIFIAGFLIASAARALTLEDAVIAANEYNANIKAARSELDADNQKKYQGFAGLLPVVSLNGSWNKTDQPDVNYSAGVTRHNYSLNITQPLFDLARFATWRRSVVTGDMAQIKYMQAQQKLIGSVITAWYNVVYLRSVLDTGIKARSAYSAQLKQSQQALSLGEGTLLDVAEAQANYDKSDADVLTAENDLNDGNLLFRQLTGLSADTIPDTNMSCVRYSESLSIDTLKEISARNNLNVLAALQTIKGSEADIISATSSHLPVVTLQAGYGKNWSRAENGNVLDSLFGTTSKTDNTSITLNVSVPIFAGGSHISQSIEAAHRFTQSKDLLLDARRNSEQDTLKALSEFRNSEARIKAYARAISSARTRLSSTRYGRELGQRTLIDVLNAEKDYYKSIQELASARNSWIRALVSLTTATGELDYTVVKRFSCSAGKAG